VDNSGLRGKIAHSRYLCTCTAANERHLKSLDGVDPGKIHMLYHGIDVAAIEPVGPIHRPFTFVAVGRMVEKKGFQFLLEACAELNRRCLDFRLHFVGSGPLEDRLKAQCEALGLADCVEFRGMSQPNDMKRQYLEADVLVMPSIVDDSGDRDGLPNVCLEAMNEGLPIIGSDVSGIPEGVADGENGWLVPPGDAQRLAEAMADAIQSDRLGDMKRAARRMVMDRFSLERNIAALRQRMTDALAPTPGN
jgi:glycosyltransferase involved in cell wall biosynthesis